jgi:hypothetical protein
MRRGPTVGGIIIVVWLIIGLIAAGQRGYLTTTNSCAKASTVLVTVIAGPLNYIGVNPKIQCLQPSK